ncbi:hypothetical protein FK513_29140, partial [Klebsiella pneumoniae]
MKILLTGGTGLIGNERGSQRLRKDAASASRTILFVRHHSIAMQTRLSDLGDKRYQAWGKAF